MHEIREASKLFCGKVIVTELFFYFFFNSGKLLIVLTIRSEYEEFNDVN